MLAGWRPRTWYSHDDDGRVISSTTESPWEDPWELAALDAYLNWKANLHSCGRPMTESLKGASSLITDASDYVVGTQICLACMALEQHNASLSSQDEKERQLSKSVINPHAWRVQRVNTRAEAIAIQAAQAAQGDPPAA